MATGEEHARRAGDPVALSPDEQVLLDAAREALGREGVPDEEMTDHASRILRQTSTRDPDWDRAWAVREAILSRRIEAAVVVVRWLTRIPDADDAAVRACEIVRRSCGPARPARRTPEDDADWSRACLLLNEWRDRNQHLISLRRLEEGIAAMAGRPLL